MPPSAESDLTVLERPRLIRKTCSELPVAGLNGERVAALNRIEVGGCAGDRTTHRRLRLVFWNVERGRDPGGVADLLQLSHADIALLCELDNGLDRTGGQHVACDLAVRMNAAYIYGVEFIELEEPGARCWHGNAIISRVACSDPLLMRLAEDDTWMSGRGRHRRLGGRMALAARVPLGGRDVVVVSTHLESHGSPLERATQMSALIDAVEAYAAGSPVLIGGDFNTRTASKDEMRSSSVRRSLEQSAPGVFVAPETREPLFDVAREAGYDWSACNRRLPTERTHVGLEDSPRFRLDWFFSRGLDCSAPRILVAEAPDGRALSDHDAIGIDIRLAEHIS
jgi:endonuclease/exonuclease/phosphatase family metal-dependent hydrolase